MKSIYKSESGKEAILSLYDKQLQRLSVPYTDLYVDTTFGKTHLIETGNLQGEAILVFHGGNATTAYNLLALDFLLKDFHIYAVDTIGHPGKSAEVSLSFLNYDYGKWACEVIEALNYENMACFGGSFGAGVLAKAMCVGPNKIKRAVLYVPSAINNAPAINSISMGFPMIMYWLTHKVKWLEKSILPMAVTKENISNDIFETAKNSIDHAKIKAGMPSNVRSQDMLQCHASTLIMAAEKDCLFPAHRVLPRAEKIFLKGTTYLLKNRGHIHELTLSEKKMIVDFLLKEDEKELIKL